LQVFSNNKSLYEMWSTKQNVTPLPLFHLYSRASYNFHFSLYNPQSTRTNSCSRQLHIPEAGLYHNNENNGDIGNHTYRGTQIFNYSIIHEFSRVNSINSFTSFIMSGTFHSKCLLDYWEGGESVMRNYNTFNHSLFFM
jgi:hypothetical protein